MSLADHDVTAAPNRVRCSICALIDTMSDDDKATLQAWFDDPQSVGELIAQALTETYGKRYTGTTVLRHRRGKCRGA
jgi:hypothetical protein